MTIWHVIGIILGLLLAHRHSHKPKKPKCPEPECCEQYPCVGPLIQPRR